MRAISKALCKFVQKWLPSAYVLALLLTLVAFLGAWGLTDSSLLDCVKYMSQGMYSLLSFTMQMVLVLVTGHCLASSKPVKKLLTPRKILFKMASMAQRTQKLPPRFRG